MANIFTTPLTNIRSSVIFVVVQEASCQWASFSKIANRQPYLPRPTVESLSIWCHCPFGRMSEGAVMLTFYWICTWIQTPIEWVHVIILNILSSNLCALFLPSCYASLPCSPPVTVRRSSTSSVVNMTVHECKCCTVVRVTLVCTGSSRPSRGSVGRFALKRVPGPEGVLQFICLELNFNRKVWRGFTITDNAEELRKHRLWNVCISWDACIPSCVDFNCYYLFLVVLHL